MLAKLELAFHCTGQPMSSQKDKRKFPRRDLWYPAKIDLGGGLAPRDCQLRDVSVTGARIKLEKLNDLPQEFVLLLADIGRPHRHCRVVWRNATEAGVKFSGADIQDGTTRTDAKQDA